DRADTPTKRSFEVVEAFLDTEDYKMVAKLRNVIAFHYDPRLIMRRYQEIVQKSSTHISSYSLGTSTLDWYFELGDLIADLVVVRDIFGISAEVDIGNAVVKVLDRLHVIGVSFTDFGGYFIRHVCSKR